MRRASLVVFRQTPLQLSDASPDFTEEESEREQDDACVRVCVTAAQRVQICVSVSTLYSSVLWIIIVRYH